MRKQSDNDYFAARLRAESEAAAAASSDEARAAHQALADHYAELLAANGHPVEIERADLGTQGADGIAGA
jgi:hypothetical protein